MAFVFIEAEAPRVQCPKHGVVVAAVPWARHGAWFTRPFEDETAWLVAHTDKTTVSTLMRISWRTVGRIIERVGNELGAKFDRFANLKRIGVDEIAYRKGHRYLTVVIDHDSGRLVWAHEGKDAAALRWLLRQASGRSESPSSNSPAAMPRPHTSRSSRGAARRPPFASTRSTS